MIKKLLIALILMLGAILNITDVYAGTLLSEHSGYYYYRQYADGGRGAGPFNNYYLDGVVAYCIEPRVEEGTNNYIEGNWSVTGLSDAVKKRVTLIAYYGYSYTGHQTQKYRLATQSMIWEAIMGSGTWVRVQTEDAGHGSQIDISIEKTEIERLISNHVIKPSFNGQTISDAKVGEAFTLHDNNNVLSNFEVNATGASVSTNGNDLIVTPTNTNVSISMKKKMIYTENFKIFYGDGIQKILVRGNVDPVYATVGVEAEAFGSIEINKRDSETGSTPQGQATLRGAVYGVYTLDGSLVTEITTDSSGYGKAEELEFGEYYLKEISRSLGYWIDNNRYYFTVGEANIDVSLNVKEVVVKNYVSILKQFDFVNGNSTLLTAEPNISFEIYYPDGRLFNTLITDKNGYASMTIPYGTWKLHQVNSHDGYSKVNDFYITIDYHTPDKQYYNILNNKLNAYLQVLKKDIETGKNIEITNTTFKILNTDTNQYVSQYVGGKVYSEFKTDDKGMFTTYLPLEAGNYRLIEISEPNGYLLDVNGLDFNIGGNETYYYYSSYGVFVKLEFSNTPIKGVIEIKKTGEVVKFENNDFFYEQKPLAGVTFDIYASEDILTADGKHLYFMKDKKVDTITTNYRGYAISKELPLGKYYVVEVSTKDGYILDSNPYYFNLSKIDNNTRVVYNSFSKLNYLKKGKLEFSKTDLTTGKPIPNTLIEVYTEYNELVFKGLTKDDGTITITNLFAGNFYIVEKEPATGYVLNKNKIFFEIKENGEVVKSNMTNEKIKSIVKIHKTDENNKALSGVEIGIFNLDNNLIGKYITDKNGYIEVELEYGSYYYQELKTIKGYILNDEKIYFEVINNDEVIESTLINKELFEVPNTGLSSINYLIIVSIIFILIGIGLINYDIIKRKK